MKGKIFLIALAALMLSCAFAIGAYAKEYNPTNGVELNQCFTEIKESQEDAVINLSGDYKDYDTSEGHTVSAPAGVSITLNLTGDTDIGCRMNIVTPTYVLVKLNGLTIRKTGAGRGGDQGCLFRLGATGAFLEFESGTIDSNDAGIYFHLGSLKMNGVYLVSSEEAIWCSSSCQENIGRGYYINDCRIECRAYNTDVFCPSNDSYITNTVFVKGTVEFDSWHKHGSQKISDMVIENVDMSNVDIGSSTSQETFKLKNSSVLNVCLWGDNGGGGTFVLEDCTYNSIGSYNNKNGSVVVITSPTCDFDGTRVVFDKDHQDGAKDNEYVSPKLGHGFDASKITGVKYESYLEKGTYTSLCVRCESGIASEDTPSAEALFEFIGYSTPENGTYGIVASFSVNLKAVEEYESRAGKTLSYGIVAGAKAILGDKNPLDESGNATVFENGSVVKAEISKGYASYDFVLMGLNENQLDMELVIATYVITAEENDGDTYKDVVYLQSEQVLSGLKSISYLTVGP